MKPNMTSFPCLLLVLAFAFPACEKEDLQQPAAHIKAASFEIDLPPDAASLLDAPVEPANDCHNLPPCDEHIEKLKEIYLPVANRFCCTIWLDVTCCQDGEPAMALVPVVPTKCGCFPGAGDE